MTTAELVAVSGTPEKRLRATLRAMVAAGTVRVSRRTIRTLDGRATPVSSYLLVGR
jgi:hypothetical protein